MNKKLDKTPLELYKEPIQKNPYEDTISKVQRDQNYKSFYNSALQLYNLKSKTNKYLNNHMAESGMNTQGYGTSVQAGVNNQAINLYAQNEENYANNEQTITDEAARRYENKQTESDNQLITFLQNDVVNGDSEAVNKHMANYGYMIMNEDGSYSYTAKWDSLDSDRKAYIQSILDGNSNKTVNTGGAFDYTNSKVVTYDSNGNSLGITDNRFNIERTTLDVGVQSGEITRNSYVQLVNEHGESVYLYYGSDGAFYYVTPDNFDSSNAYLIEGRDKNILKVGKNQQSEKINNVTYTQETPKVHKD